MIVQELIDKLIQMPLDAPVAIKASDNGFNFMPANAHFVSKQMLRKNDYGVWSNNWSTTKTDENKIVIVIS